MANTNIVNPYNQYGKKLLAEDKLKDNKIFYHSFSTLGVNPELSLNDSRNKAGHTVLASEIWGEEIPNYLKLNDIDLSTLTFNKNTVVNLSTLGVSKNLIFDGNTWNEFNLTDGTTFSNQSNSPTVKYYKNRPLSVLTDKNNQVSSDNKALRLFINNKPILSFIAPNDIIDENIHKTSEGYKVNIYSNGTLITKNFFIDYYSGIILLDEKFNYPLDTLTIDCFAYVGNTIDKLIKATKDYNTVTRLLQDSEKTIGFIVLENAKDLINFQLNGNSISVPYTVTDKNLTIKLFSPDIGENINTVYNGMLNNLPITYTILI